MRSLVRKIRERFHPLFYARKSPLGRFVIRILDQPAWLSIEGVTFKARGRILTHGLAFAITGSQETTSEAVMTACIRLLPLRSFWDVGANIGYYTWLMKSARPEIEAVLMEPLPANAALIAETIRVNRLTRTTLIAKAASSSNGFAKLNADTMAGATSSLEIQENTFEQRHWNATSKAIEIPIATIDATRDGFGPIDLMKIDVEGHEESVLSGAQRTIAADQPIILIECGHNGHCCLSPLENMGYVLIPTEGLNFLCVPPRHQSDLPRITSRALVPPRNDPSATAHGPN